MLQPYIAGLVCLLSIVATSATFAKELNVGEKAPSFTLPDQEGNSRSLVGLLKEGNVAIVFHRSASW